MPSMATLLCLAQVPSSFDGAGGAELPFLVIHGAIVVAPHEMMHTIIDTMFLACPKIRARGVENAKTSLGKNG